MHAEQEQNKKVQKDLDDKKVQADQAKSALVDIVKAAEINKKEVELEKEKTKAAQAA